MVNTPYAQSKHLAGINLGQGMTTIIASDSYLNYKTNPIGINPK
jgi:hypothetical protein